MDTKKQARKEIMVVIICIVSIAVFLTWVVWYARTHRRAQPDNSVTNLVIDTRATDEAKKAENPLADRQVYFAGIEDTVVSKTDTIELENLPANEDFVMRYVITDLDTNEQIYETDLIPSGEHVNWTPAETLPPGTYNIAFTEIPFYPTGADDEFIPLTQGRNVIKLIVKE